jgi:hypothetical protein
MAEHNEVFRVTLGADGYYPQTFEWRGRLYRVLAPEGVQTLGMERHYRVSTGSGHFELALNTVSGRWRLLRSPGWLARLLANWQHMPRYPLPVRRRRRYRPALQRRPVQRAELCSAEGRQLQPVEAHVLV